MALALDASAQFTVTGTISGPDGEGCANAVYHIYAPSDTIRPIVNALTDLDGHFSQPLTHAGEYLLQAEYLGLNTVMLPFSVTETLPQANLGDIVMNPLDNTLDEVVVTGQRRMIVSDGANLQYDVQADPTSQTSTILEMLRKVPMITVDGEDNIRLNGSTDFRIYLNGKPNPMFDSEPQRVLKAIPASTISRIEVLTEPGAKYDAEGTGGILNIVTEVGGQQQVADGYAGSVSAQVGIDQVAGTAYVRGKYRKVSGSASVTYAHGPVIGRGATSRGETEYLDNDREHLFVTDMRQDIANPFDFLQGNVALNWEPNEKNLFAASLNITDISGDQNMTGNNMMYDKAGSLLWEMPREQYAHLSRLNLTFDASWQYLFRGADHSLTTSVQVNHGNQEIRANTYEDNVFTNNMMDTKTNEYTLQLDWHNRINDKHTVEAGAKGVLTDNRNDSHTSVNASPEEGVRMKQHRNMAAVYGSYSAYFGPLSATAGLRYEFTNLGVDFLTPGRDDFDSYLNDLVPNVSLSWSFTPMSTLRLAYNMRISRPDIDKLNPYQFSFRANEVQMGNPDLTSQRSNNVSLAWSSFTGKVQYNLKAEYQNVNNLISSFSYMDGDVLYNTFLNSGTQQKGILSGYFNWFITPQIMLSVNGAVEYTDYSVKHLDMANHGWSGNAGGNFSWTLPCRINLSAYGGWSSSSPTLQGSRSGYDYYGLGISRKFLKDESLKLSLSASNMFTHWTRWKSKTVTPTSISRTVYSRQSWSVNVGVEWSFGHLKQNVRTVNSRIDNNDKASTGSSEGGLM